jgi:ABC-type polysaccharide/polyol phosphate transport system ATPase subunit
MQAPVVFDGVWKKFKRGEHHDSLRDLIPSVLRRRIRSAPRTGQLDQDEFWAVRDISFQVERGSALGIIGANGAGKSTTLKLLTRILRPTMGHCALSGRVGALIEVAAGFHPDLTGRENISLQGAIMGMRRSDILSQFDQIVEFSGLSEFIDTPVKRYSSGMNARLGFAIAAHLNPDVLIIDEVLAVGDAAFQRRCFERIKKLRRQGVTLVFVSHNLAAVEALCDTTLVLEKGTQRFRGSPREATASYLESAGAAPAPHRSNALFERRGDQGVEIRRVSFGGRPDGSTASVPTGEPLEIALELHANVDAVGLFVGFLVTDAANLRVYGENSGLKISPFDVNAGESLLLRVRIASLALTPGQYRLTVGVQSLIGLHVFDWHENAYEVDVIALDDPSRTGQLGLLAQWELARVDSKVNQPSS